MADSMDTEEISKPSGYALDECFYLSKIFSAHKNDVKSVVGTSTGSIISGSRDGTVKLWTERTGSYKETFELKQRKNFAINTIAFYQTPDGEWLIFAGVKDGTIEVFNSPNSPPQTVLNNHTQNAKTFGLVCVLFVDQERKLLISGSWDARAVVWSIDKILSGAVELGRELVHHKNSVWAAITLPGTENVCFLTGSADRTIKLHNHNFEEIRTFMGHTDVIRSLVAVSSTEFVSAANDGTIRLWNVESSSCLQKSESIAGEFIYTVAKLEHKSGKRYIIAGMERGFVEIWCLRDNNLVSMQNFRIPVSSLWSVAVLRNSDIVLGASNGVIYIYTTDESKKANEELIQSFDAEFSDLLAREIAAQKSHDDDIVTIKVALDDGAPSLELKYIKGEDPCITAEKFIKENHLPYSYCNEITEYIKSNIPEARLADAAKYRRQETQRQVVDGQKYDYAFEVKLSPDSQPLSLCYNIGEDPDFAAQRFVEQNNLPVKFLSQLSNYLSTQVPELAVGSGSSGGFVRIGQGTTNNAGSSSYVDPFTGVGRYVPGGGAAQANGTLGGDPLTSSGRYIPGAGEGSSTTYSGQIDKKRPRGVFVPIRQFFQFGLEGTASKAVPKLREMNDLQPEELKLSEEQITAMIEIMSTTNFEVSETHIRALEISLKWSLETITPALDVFRLALLNFELNKAFCVCTQDGEISEARGKQTLHRLSLLLISDPPDPVRVFVCRALANAAIHEAGRQMLMTDIATTCKIVINQLIVPKAIVQIAATSAIANFARLLLTETEAGKVTELGPREDALRAIINRTEELQSFSEFAPVALFRLLQSIATLMWGDSTVIELAKSRGVDKITTKIKDSVTDESGKALCRDITEMIYAV